MWETIMIMLGVPQVKTVKQGLPWGTLGSYIDVNLHYTGEVIMTYLDDWN